MDYEILEESPSEGIMITHNPEAGIDRLFIDCEDPILVIECPLFKLENTTTEVLADLLRKNRDIVHGAFVLTEDDLLIFRDTLQLENLDKNELEGSLESLELLLAEFATQLIEISKN